MLPENGGLSSTRTPFPISPPLRQHLPWQADQGARRPTSKYILLSPRGIVLTFSRTSSKANTVWPMENLQPHVPSVIFQELLTNCRYYVKGSNSIQISSDSQRGQTENRADTHRRLNEEIKKLYLASVPGVTPPEQKAKIEQLYVLLLPLFTLYVLSRSLAFDLPLCRPKKPIGGFGKAMKAGRMDSGAAARFKREVQLAKKEKLRIKKEAREQQRLQTLLERSDPHSAHNLARAKRALGRSGKP